MVNKEFTGWRPDLPHQERVFHVQQIAEGYIESARTDVDFGTERGFYFGYACGLLAGWFHGGLITEKEMDEYRRRLSEAIRKRRGRR